MQDDDTKSLWDARDEEVLSEMPADPTKTGFTRRATLKGLAIGSAAVAAACSGDSAGPNAGQGENAGPDVKQAPRLSTEPTSEPPEKEVKRELLSACPYCGVGCGTIIKTEKGKIVGMVPDPKHPTNKGLQCIKGLSSNEAIYVDRIQKVLIRKDLSDPLNGYESKTKGSFKDEDFREATWEEAEELITDRIAAIVEQRGGNSVGLYGSGQLSVEGQYLENLFMKGVLGSNTIEANARMCMTSAVTGYFKSLGSDTPPCCYDDIELADMICNWGHNARGSHPIVFWRIADHKKKNGIPTLVVDPRRTGTVMGYEEIGGTENSFHFRTINGDISIHNALAYLMLTKYKDAVAWDLLKKHTAGWEEYVEGVKARYNPADVVDRTMVDPAYLDKVAEQWAAASIKGRENGTGGVLAFWGIGYNQHIHGQNNTVSLINLLTLTGNIGRPGCGPFSMTGQPNAMGERLTGGLTGRLPFNQGLSNVAHRDWIADNWGVPRERLEAVASAKNPGMAIGMMERAQKGEVLAMFLIYATHIDLPDQNTLVRPALSKTFNIVQEIYRHAPNNLYADVILPACTWGEWWGGTYIQSERRFFVCDGTANPLENTRGDLDMVIDKGKMIAKRLGLDSEKIFPWKKHDNGFYDPEEIFRAFIVASKGSDADMTGMLEVEKRDGIGLYDQIRQLRGIQWPAPTYEIAKAGGTKRRYLNQEDGSWSDKPYGAFRHKDGKLHMHLCEQDYSNRREMADKLSVFGTVEGAYCIDNLDLLVEARDKGLTPELPDFEAAGVKAEDIPKGKYPYWIGLGVVYEHFHTAKTVRQGTTRRLVPEMYIEMHPDDAKELGVVDGEWVEIETRRGKYEARASIGLDSVVRPARNLVPKGYMFSPWNLSVADSADPATNKWLVNRISHRAFDPVSGQVDFKKLACRINKLNNA